MHFFLGFIGRISILVDACCKLDLEGEAVMAKMCFHDALIDEFYSSKSLSSTCTCNKNSTLNIISVF